MTHDSTIQGQKLEEVFYFADSRGWLLDLLSTEYVAFDGFGHLYLSVVHKGTVKGWHKHMSQSEVVMCVAGLTKIVCYDGREGSPTRGVIWEDVMGEGCFKRVLIPKGVLHAWQGLSDLPAHVVVVANQPYNRDSPDTLVYDLLDPAIPYVFA